MSEKSNGQSLFDALHARFGMNPNWENASADTRQQYELAASDITVPATAPLLKRIEELEALANLMWPQINQRRGRLIDLSSQGLASINKAAELDRLQTIADQFLDLMSPPDDRVLSEIESKLQLRK